MSSTKPSPESSSIVSITSSALSETKTQNQQTHKQEAVLQSFQLQSEEEILLFTSSDLYQLDNENNSQDVSNKVKSSPFRKLICVTKNENGEEHREVLENNKKSSTPSSDKSSNSSKESQAKDAMSSPGQLFEQKTVASLEAIKSKYLPLLGYRNAYIIVTNTSIYLLRMVQNPVDMYLSCVMQGRVRDSDVLSRCFGLDKVSLMELAGDIR